jgi:Flp pilus assembly protein TadB
MNVGIMVLIVMGAVLLGQAFVQGQEHRRRHEELMRKLDELAGKSGG